jgi:hypothetical protein
MLPPPRVSRRTARDTHTPGILEKRLQAIENKGSECEETRRETTKRRQAVGDKRVERKSATQRALRSGNLDVEGKNYRATQIDVKTKELRK